VYQPEPRYNEPEPKYNEPEPNYEELKPNYKEPEPLFAESIQKINPVQECRKCRQEKSVPLDKQQNLTPHIIQGPPGFHY
jgi:hypothetical protein